MTFPASLRVAIAVACGFFQEVFVHPCSGTHELSSESGPLSKDEVVLNKVFVLDSHRLLGPGTAKSCQNC